MRTVTPLEVLIALSNKLVFLNQRYESRLESEFEWLLENDDEFKFLVEASPAALKVFEKNKLIRPATPGDFVSEEFTQKLSDIVHRLP